MKRNFFTTNIWLKLASLILAIVLWFFVISGGRSVIVMNVPIEFINIPQGLEMLDVPKTVNIGIRGQEKLLKELKRDDLRVVIDLSKSKSGETFFNISEKNIKLPGSFLITSISPQRISLILEERLKKDVSVKPVVVGLLTHGFVVEAIKTVPETVGIEGPRSVVAKIHMVKTEPIDVTGINKNLQYTAHLEPPDPDVKTNILKVEVNISVRKK